MKKQILLKVIAHALLLIVLYVLQELVFSRLFIMGVCPVIIPISVIGVAIFGGQNWGVGYGTAAGLICDMVFRTLPGMSIIFVVVGLFVGILADSVMSKGFLSYFICSIVMLILTAGVQMFGFLVFEGIEAKELVDVAIKQTIYSMLFIIPLYFPARHISRKVRHA